MTKTPPIKTQRATVGHLLLDNGLQLVWEQDHRQGLVAIDALIKGGLRAEGSYLGTGITHFMEHMLFKGTSSRPPGSIDKEVRSYGGTINAFTSFDSTGVTLFVESRYLAQALDLVADVLQNAQFDAQEFEKERNVIISEIQMNLDDPERRLHNFFFARHYLVHPYRYPILGYQSLLKRLTVDDLRAFYASQYHPENIVLSCVGDLDGEDLSRLVKGAFGKWARGMADPNQMVVALEPPAASAQYATLEMPTQAAYVMTGFSSTRVSDPDTYPLDVLANILGHGRACRLYKTLVRERKLAHTIASWNFTPYDRGVFNIFFRTDPDKVDEALRAVREVLDDVVRHGVSAAELEKAKRQVSADYLFGLQTVESRAADLAGSMLYTGDPLFSRRYVDGIKLVTGKDVQAVARRYYRPSRMTTVAVRPLAEGASTKQAETPGPEIQVSRSVLDNGATTLVGIDGRLPIAAIVVAFRGGLRVEETGQEGISNLVAQMLTKGTNKESAEQISEQIESMGAKLQTFSGLDGFGITLELLSDDIEKGIDLAYELVSQSIFPKDEVSLQRQIITSQLQAQEDDIFHVGVKLLREALFREHPYRFNSLGSLKTVGGLSREQCLEFARRWLVAANMVVSVFGDVDQALVDKTLEGTFGKMHKETSLWPEHLGKEIPFDSVRAASKTMDREQAVVMLGFRGSTRTAADRDALDVMTQILSGMAGRLFQAVREKRGLSYTLGATNHPGWDPGYILVYAGTRPDERKAVLSILLEQLKLAASSGFNETELEDARRTLIGQHRLGLQSVAGLAQRAALDELYGVGYDAWRTYEARLKKLTLADVNGAAARYLTVGRHAQVIVSPDGHKANLAQ